MKSKLFFFHQSHSYILMCCLFSLSLMVIVSCGGEKEVAIPGHVYSRDTMINILAGIHIAESQIGQTGYRPDAMTFKTAYMQDVLSQNSVDTSRFNTSFEFYSTHPQLFSQMYEEVIAEISRRHAAQE